MADDYKPQIWHLSPHRSLSPAGRRMLLGATTALSAVMAGVFAMKGLWPMIFFTAIPPLGLTFGLAANNRNAREWQEIKLDRQNLTVTHHHPNWRKPQITVIPPYALRVDIVMDESKGHEEDIELPPRCNHILLKTQGRTYEIGAFLPPDEKLGFGKALRNAINDWNRGPVAPTPLP